MGLGEKNELISIPRTRKWEFVKSERYTNINQESLPNET